MSKLHPIDSIRVRVWFEELRRRLGLRSPRAVGRELEPTGFDRKTASGDPYYWRKWNDYAAGRRKPQRKLVALVEQTLPGTAALLNHVLWETLREESVIHRLLRNRPPSLGKEAYNAALKIDALLDSQSSYRWFKLGSQMDVLVRCADMNVIAYLLILLRVGIQTGDQTLAFEAGRAILKASLVLFSFQPFQGLSTEFFVVLERWLVPHARRWPFRLDLSGFDFHELTEELSWMLSSANDWRSTGRRYRNAVLKLIENINVLCSVMTATDDGKVNPLNEMALPKAGPNKPSVDHQ